MTRIATVEVSRSDNTILVKDVNGVGCIFSLGIGETDERVAQAFGEDDDLGRYAITDTYEGYHAMADDWVVVYKGEA